MLPRQEFADHATENGRAAHAAAGHEFEADLARLVMHHSQADVVHGDGRAVFDGAVDRHLELAGQGDELGVKGRPLAQDFGEGAGIDDLVAGDAGEFVGGDVADAVARGLNRVHFHRGQVKQDVRRLFQLDPVELDVLARREVAVAAVVGAGDVGEHAHLFRRQQAIRHGDAQHVGVTLHVQAVLQAQRQELGLGQLVAEAAPYLVAVLGDALAYDEVVKLVVTVHKSSSWKWYCRGWVLRSPNQGSTDSFMTAHSAHEKGAQRCCKSSPCLGMSAVLRLAGHLLRDRLHPSE